MRGDAPLCALVQHKASQLDVLEHSPLGNIGLLERCAVQCYRGYKIEMKAADANWCCFVTPEHPDLPILWRCALLYTTKSEAIADAKRRVDAVLAL